MAIINLTPDSFSDGGTFFAGKRVDVDGVLRHVESALVAGADLLDIGGESTRPGATPVSEQEELDRVLPVLEAIVSRFEVPVSLDTSTARVMVEGAARGAAMINDVRALRREGALTAAASTNLPICLMHMQGEPGSMQAAPHYDDVCAEVMAFFEQRVVAAAGVGIARERLVIDPGFGFGKTLDHNLALFRALGQFAKRFPLLVGVSRKSMIGALLDNREVSGRVSASVALALMAAQAGAAIVRVHDVEPTADALKMLRAVGQ